MKHSPLFFIGTTFASCVVLAVGVWMLGGHQGIAIDFGEGTLPLSATETPPPERPIPDGYKEYHNGVYHISLFYPDNLTAKEIPENNGAMTVTFEYLDAKVASGFQIFIVPFSGGQITEERFKEDVPSGVKQNLKNIQVGGATGASFNSTNKILGATYEVWFTHGGYLFEANTFKETQPMLDSSMSSVLFY